MIDLYYRQYEQFLGVFKCNWWELIVYDGCSCNCSYPANTKIISELRHATMLEF